MNTLQATWIWPIIILLSTLAVTLSVFLFPEIGIRPIVIMSFLFIIPGMTIVRFFDINDLAVEWMLAIALSFTIDSFSTGIMLYTGIWSPVRILVFLIIFCLLGANIQQAVLCPITSLPLTNSEKTISLDKPELANEKD